MRKIHVITQKELVEDKKIKGTTAVVIDVLLATSTIVMALEKGMQQVNTVKDSEAGFTLYNEDVVSNILMGEQAGNFIEGMQYPDPNLFEAEENKGKKSLILLTTNGTVAIENALSAKALYVSSLLNGHRIAEDVHKNEEQGSIVLVCAGNHGRFSMEDFIGAGQIIYYLIEGSSAYTYSLSDSSKAALESYRLAKKERFNILHSVETTELLRSKGFPEATPAVINNIEKVDLISKYENDRIIKK